jgi:hypothetical protein
MQLPTHPQGDEPASARDGQPSPSRWSPSTVLLAAVAGAALVALVVLHLTGVVGG